MPPNPIFPSTTYFFYANAHPPSPTKVSTTDPLALGRAYEAGSPFAAVPDNDFAFKLTGAVIPEPSTLTLLALGSLGLLGYARRRRK